MNPKKFWKSKTFWINLIPFILKILSVTGVIPDEANLLVENLTSEEMLTLAAANMGVRSVTNSPVTFRG